MENLKMTYKNKVRITKTNICPHYFELDEFFDDVLETDDYLIIDKNKLIKNFVKKENPFLELGFFIEHMKLDLAKQLMIDFATNGGDISEILNIGKM